MSNEPIECFKWCIFTFWSSDRKSVLTFKLNVFWNGQKILKEGSWRLVFHHSLFTNSPAFNGYPYWNPLAHPSNVNKKTKQITFNYLELIYNQIYYMEISIFLVSTRVKAFVHPWSRCAPILSPIRSINKFYTRWKSKTRCWHLLLCYRPWRGPNPKITSVYPRQPS